MINMIEDLKKQGLDPEKYYEAVVVANDDRVLDGKMCKRIQARVVGLFDNIPDEHLPWAVSMFPEEADGSSATYGTCNIPAINSKVFLKFQGGKEDHPVYYSFSGNASTVLDEAKVNYPNRKVVKMSNGAIVIVDKQTNELIISNPGDLKITVVGNANIQVLGNSNTTTSGDATIHSDGAMTVSSGGKMDLTSDTGIALSAPRIDWN